MKLVTLTDVTAYRMHAPKWAVAPTSGAGAGKHGGRANRPGIDAIYLALETQAAINEYQKTSTLLPPGTLTSYKLSATPVVDFTGGYSASVWEPIWEDFYCDWRELWFNQGVEPPSWIAADLALAAGAKGILFSSRLAAGGTNLVLFNGSLDASDLLEVHDPANALPQNQASWP